MVSFMVATIFAIVIECAFLLVLRAKTTSYAAFVFPVPSGERGLVRIGIFIGRGSFGFWPIRIRNTERYNSGYNAYFSIRRIQVFFHE